MSVKLRFLRSHLKFPHNLGDYGEERGQRFRWDLRVMVERYQAIISKNIDFCLRLCYVMVEQILYLCRLIIDNNSVQERFKLNVVSGSESRAGPRSGSRAGGKMNFCISFVAPKDAANSSVNDSPPVKPPTAPGGVGWRPAGPVGTLNLAEIIGSTHFRSSSSRR
ncbi:hypothetical protein EVAR_60793_1 [Eumeta japonica]|uniref:Uncharacterized protein n=1 Tax=Eumeta variegata TaxID=151549 RepID=A0A4C2A1E1_EUMVA|nr:hypothetical protein EVAR_60793_1 [Eumeta japonica]